jgi:hypothetical protein
MKRKLVFISVLAALFTLLSCGKIKDYGTAAVEGAEGGTDTATYPFESASDYPGPWQIHAVSTNPKFISAEISSDKAYMGSSSLKIQVNYDAGNSGGVLTIGGTNLQMKHKTITARVWVPAGMGTSTNKYGGTIFIQLGAPGYHWYETAWMNLTPPAGNVAGKWNTITANVDTDVIYNTKTLDQNAEDGNTAVLWGVKIGQGGSSPNYTGYIYIDSINIQ